MGDAITTKPTTEEALRAANGALRFRLEWVVSRCQSMLDGRAGGGDWSADYLRLTYREIAQEIEATLAAERAGSIPVHTWRWALERIAGMDRRPIGDAGEEMSSRLEAAGIAQRALAEEKADA